MSRRDREASGRANYSKTKRRDGKGIKSHECGGNAYPLQIDYPVAMSSARFLRTVCMSAFGITGISAG